MVPHFWFLELVVLETISIHTLLLLGGNKKYIFEGTYHARELSTFMDNLK